MALNEVFATKGLFLLATGITIDSFLRFQRIQRYGRLQGNVDNRNTERTNIEIYVWNSAGSFTELHDTNSGKYVCRSICEVLFNAN